MGWSVGTVDGFLLASTVADVDAADVARAGATQPVSARIRERAAALQAVDPSERRTRLRQIAAMLREPTSADAQMPARARALLAREMPRDVGRIWLLTAGPVRRGFGAGPGLRDVVRRTARQARPDDAGTAAHERGVGREILARALRGRAEDERARLLGKLGPDEAAAVLALEPLLADDGTEPIVVLLGAATALRGADRTRVAGAVALGFRGDGGGAGPSVAWRRAGREIAELVGAGCHA